MVNTDHCLYHSHLRQLTYVSCIAGKHAGVEHRGEVALGKEGREAPNRQAKRETTFT